MYIKSTFFPSIEKMEKMNDLESNQSIDEAKPSRQLRAVLKSWVAV